MTFILIKYLRKFITALISGNTPHQIAMGFSIGVFMGLTPSNFIINLIVITFLFLLNINTTAGFLSSGIFSLFSFLLYPFEHKIGSYLLITNTSLKDLWTSLYNAPIIPYTHFNNTVMIGSLVIAALLFLPLYFLMKSFIVVYRKKYHDAFINSSAFKTFKASKFAGWIFKLWRIFS